MTALYKKFLDEWENDSKVRAVLVESSSSRAFSAGYSSFLFLSISGACWLRNSS